LTDGLGATLDRLHDLRRGLAAEALGLNDHRPVHAERIGGLLAGRVADGITTPTVPGLPDADIRYPRREHRALAGRVVRAAQVERGGVL
jgi:hypothetical protein